MAVESKVIVTAEDRTRAAFAAIERNSGKTAMAMVKLQGTMLKLAGVGSLVAFFRSGAQSTELWADEMARLDEITEKFFKTSAETGRLDPFIAAVKLAYKTAFGASMAIDNLGLAIGSLAAATALALQGEFAEARRAIEQSSLDMAENEERFRKLREEIDKPAPKGFAKQKEAEDEARKKRQKEEADRLKELIRLTVEHARVAEDAIRAESEISEGLSGAGLTAIGESVFNEARAKEAEKAAEAEAKQRERLMRQVEIMNESFMSEQELMIQQYESRQMIIDDAFMQELVSAEEHTRLKEELELQHQAAMGDITAQGVLARRRFEEMNTKQQIQSVLGQMLQMTQGVTTHSKTLFKINKTLALANVAVSLPDAIIQSFQKAGGYPWGLIPAGLMAATGAAQIAQIKAAQFGTSTSAPSIGGGGAAPVVNVPDLSAPAQAPRPQITIYMPNDDAPLSQDWFMNKFIPTWNEKVGDGAPIILIANQ
jgi:hypothetical protein